MEPYEFFGLWLTMPTGPVFQSWMWTQRQGAEAAAICFRTGSASEGCALVFLTEVTGQRLAVRGDFEGIL
jgi:hypothetical protein